MNAASRKFLVATSAVGTQWGDEGKGRVVDWLVTNDGYLICVRYNGGNNAGHSVYINDRLIHLHFVPSGIIHPAGLALVSAGEIIDPAQLINEIVYLRSQGITTDGRIIVDPRVTVITLLKRLIDMAKDFVRGRDSGKPIGTTAKGIGPTYAARADRSGLRLHQLLGDQDQLQKLLEQQFTEDLRYLKAVLELSDADLAELLTQLGKKDQAANRELIEAGLRSPEDFDYRSMFVANTTFNIERLVDFYLEQAAFLPNYIQIKDVASFVTEHYLAGERILFEGGQGTHLDIGFGSWPYVTSSHPIAGGATVGVPFGPTLLTNVIGVAKLFTTRVGGGPFPTKDTALAELIQGMPGQPGAEFGTTTGRRRDIGHFDAVLVRSAVLFSGIGELALTKLDFLDELAELKICTHYLLDGNPLYLMPPDPTDLERVVPVYETLPGWQTPTSGIRAFEELPKAAQHYCRRITELCKLPFTNAWDLTLHSVSVGANRDQIIICSPIQQFSSVG